MKWESLWGSDSCKI